jgi:hypothetical protein
LPCPQTAEAINSTAGNTSSLAFIKILLIV